MQISKSQRDVRERNDDVRERDDDEDARETNDDDDDVRKSDADDENSREKDYEEELEMETRAIENPKGTATNNTGTAFLSALKYPTDLLLDYSERFVEFYCSIGPCQIVLSFPRMGAHSTGTKVPVQPLARVLHDPYDRHGKMDFLQAGAPPHAAGNHACKC